MGWGEILSVLIGNGILTLIINAIVNRKKAKIEEKDADVDVESKVDKLKDADRINAYEEKKKIQQMYDDSIDKYNELSKKLLNVIERNTEIEQERQKEKIWRADMERRFNELQRMYDISRCDRIECTKRKPPFNVCTKDINDKGHKYI